MTLRPAIGPIPKPRREPKAPKRLRSRSPKRKTSMDELLRGTPLAVEALPEIVPALSVPAREPVTVSTARRDVGPVLEKRAQIVSERYLAAVREMACHFCAAAGPSDPHHFPPRGSRGRNDLHVLPVCRRCHDDAQQNKIDAIDQGAAVHQTQLALFRLRGALWWVAVMREIQAGIE